MKLTVHAITHSGLPDLPPVVFDDVDGLIPDLTRQLSLEAIEGKRLVYINTAACSLVVLDDRPTEQRKKS